MAEVQIHHLEEDDGRVHFNADMDIDADGAYRAYQPNNKNGLDNPNNAHSGDDWFGCVTVSGEPVIQGPDDPASGFYVSATSLHLLQPDGTVYPRTNPAGLRGCGVNAIHRGASRRRRGRG